ncbi:MAG: hypothetical protein IT539_14075 [Bradyrhizobiaceae bacterium]|nr:hypothetical protein [Bradyrhizobiaceae bacterium]
MVLIAIIYALSGVLLGAFASVRMLTLVALVTVPAAAVSAVVVGEGLSVGLLWTLVGLVAQQTGYVVAIVVRAICFSEASDAKQSALTRW